MFFQRGQSLPVGKVTTIGSAVLTAVADRDLSHSSLVIRVNHSDWFLGQVEQPFRARVLLGSLTYASRSTNFLASKPSTAALVAANKFNVPLTFFSASVGADAAAAPFNVSFDAAAVGRVIAPGAPFPPLTVHFSGQPVDASAPKILSVPLAVQTDVALVFIPLTVYHNRLLCAASASAAEDGGGKFAPCGSFADIFAFGSVAAGERRERSLLIMNPNPLSVEVTKMATTLSDVVTLKVKLHTPQKMPANVSGVPSSGGTRCAFSLINITQSCGNPDSIFTIPDCSLSGCRRAGRASEIRLHSLRRSPVRPLLSLSPLQVLHPFGFQSNAHSDARGALAAAAPHGHRHAHPRGPFLGRRGGGAQGARVLDVVPVCRWGGEAEARQAPLRASLPGHAAAAGG